MDKSKQKGQSLVEYAVIVVVIVAIMPVIHVLGTAVAATTDRINATIITSTAAEIVSVDQNNANQDGHKP